jgi:hypothetical protein
MTAPPVQLLTFAFGPEAAFHGVRELGEALPPAVSSDFVDAEALARELSA